MWSIPFLFYLFIFINFFLFEREPSFPIPSVETLKESTSIHPNVLVYTIYGIWNNPLSEAIPLHFWHCTANWNLF
jgi:hypothetical protein